MSATSENCKVDHDLFCFVCGRYMFNLVTKSIEGTVFSDGYKDKFGLDASQRNVLWSPKRCCGNCYSAVVIRDRSTKYANPTIWNEPQNHPSDCFFCKFKFEKKGANARKTGSVQYPKGTSVVMATLKTTTPAIPETTRSVSPPNQPRPLEAGSEEMDSQNIAMFEDDPPQQAMDINDAQPSTSHEEQADTARASVQTVDTARASIQTVDSHDFWQPPRYYPEFRPQYISPKLTQTILNDNVRDLNLPKLFAELYASRQVQLLKQFTPNVVKGSFSSTSFCLKFKVLHVNFKYDFSVILFRHQYHVLSPSK